MGHKCHRVSLSIVYLPHSKSSWNGSGGGTCKLGIVGFRVRTRERKVIQTNLIHLYFFSSANINDLLSWSILSILSFNKGLVSKEELATANFLCMVYQSSSSFRT